MQSVYFGGSRNLSPDPIIPQVVGAVVAAGSRVHVGCQFGADQQVTKCAHPSFLIVFTVGSSLAVDNPPHVSLAHHKGARVVFHAGNPGGESTPIKARYLLRSIAAFQGCSSAVFFQPGAGSLAVAREALKSGIPVYAFGDQPAHIPSSAGHWVPSSFAGFSCWQWQSGQLSLL